MRCVARLFFLVAAMLALAISQVVAGEAPKERDSLNLDDCIVRALKTAPELGEAQADVALAVSRLNEAKAYRYPQIEILGLVGPVPQAKGNQVYSPDSITQTSRWTWFQKGDATIIQPLYTFGKISENMKAAESGIVVDMAKKEQTRNEVVLKVKEYYYGLLLARELKEVVLDVKEILADARNKTSRLLDKKSSTVDQMDIYKLDSFAGEIGKYLAEAEKGEALALAAVRARVGLPQDADVDIAPDQRLVADTGKAVELPIYLEAAKSKRPEYRQIREGLQARAALVEAARANYYPDFFLAANVSAANADKRTRITNPFTPDEFNHAWAGIALGLKWKIDFGITAAKLAAEKARYDRLLSTREFAETNIPLQIRKAYLEAKEAEASIEAYTRAYSNAKKWEVAAVANFDFGVGPPKEIFDALQNYARMRAGYFQSIYNFQMAMANLDYAVGENPQ